MKKTKDRQREQDLVFWERSVVQSLDRLLESREKDCSITAFKDMMLSLHHTFSAMDELLERRQPFGIILAHQPRLFDDTDDDSEYGEDFPF